MTALQDEKLVVDPGYEGIERALIDVLRRTIGRSFSRVTPDGRRLDKSAYHLLGRLEESGDIRLSDLASLVELDVSTVSRQVRQLEDAGMAARRADPDDGRAARLDITEAGRTMLADMRRDRYLLLADAMSGWSKADRVTLGLLMQRLASDLGTVMTPQDSPRTRTREATR